MAGLNCYHHESRPASATCNKCGKGLCTECADTFVTTDGSIYCVDCYKKVVGENVAQVKKVRKIIIKEFVFILVGLLVGLGLGLAMLLSGTGSVGTLFLIMAIMGSIGTIVKQVKHAHHLGWGWMWLILYAVLMCAVSPIMTIYRIIIRIKDIIKLKKIAQSDSEAIYLADQFFKMARNPEQAVENEKGEELNLDDLMKQLGASIQVAHDGSINLEEMENR